jgi:hypothetical protein
MIAIRMRARSRITPLAEIAIRSRMPDVGLPAAWSTAM